MNQSNLKNLLLPILLVPASVIVVINLLSSGGNQLGNTFAFLTMIGAVIGFVAPRAGLLIFLVFQFYADFFKRLLVLGDALSMQDVMISLGMGPIIVVAACVNSTLRCLTGKIPFLNLRDIIFFLGCVAVSIIGAFSRVSLSSDINAIGQALLGSGMLGMTAYACYALFRSPGDPHLILKTMVWAAVPMALYTFKQYFLGLATWEENYILTGLSEVLYSFYMIGGFDEIRPFSTLNTHTSVGAISGLLVLLCVLIMGRSRTLFGKRNHRLAYFVLGFIYLGSCLVCRNRTTYFIPILGLLMAWCFSGGFKTILCYLSGLALMVTAVKSSEWVYSNILTWSSQLEATAIGEWIGSIGTYQDRLRGLMALNDPHNWTPFGLPEEERPFAHDQLTEILTKFGFIPLGLLLIAGTLLLVWWHRKFLLIPDARDRKLMVALTATIIATIICALAYGNLLFVAPINSSLGFLIGVSMAVLHQHRLPIAGMQQTHAPHPLRTTPNSAAPLAAR